MRHQSSAIPLPAAVSRSLLLLLAGCAWIVASIWLLHASPYPLADRLGDADDAMRLVQLRQFLAGQGWFDLHFDRVQPPQGYDSHWSRLVDAGLAGLYRLIVPATGAERAEVLMRAAWPLLLWLFPAFAAVAFAAARIAGLPAAVLALIFSAVSIAGLEQFRPGRIDHHNVQIALAVLSVAAVVWSDRSRVAAAFAGLCVGAMLAMGLENSPFVMIAGAAMAARYVLAPDAGRATAAFGWALAAAALAVLLVSVPPWAMAVTRCDAVAINIALPVAVGGVLLALAGSVDRVSATPARRVAAAGFALVVAAALFAGIEPDCLGGPFARVDPAIRPIWLDHVKEARSFFGTIEVGRAAAAAGCLAYPLAALLAGVAMSARSGRHDLFPRLVLLAGLAASLVLLMALIRSFTYAVWFAVPVMAVAVADAWRAFRLDGAGARALSGVVASPLAVTAAAVLLTQALAPAANDNAESGQESACAASASYRTLAGLPPGLVVSEINLAPLVLALTPHSVLAAPYHRLSSGILDTHRFFASSAPEAHAIARARNIDYVYVCPTFVFGGFDDVRHPGTLWHDLVHGRQPPWLELVPQSAEEPIRIFRVAG